MKNKKIVVSKMSMLKEHKRIIPELKKAGLSEEASRQTKELKELKNK
jgi:hypothetical protein